MKSSQPTPQEFWNARFSATDYAYGTEPNEFFRAELARLAPGRILLPAEGEGRNAVHAAASGWSVDCFDFSDAARAKALALAASRGVSIRYELAPLTELASLPFEHGGYDALALVFVHQPSSIRRTIHRALIDFLKPGGVLIGEAFSKAQLGNDSGGPPDIDMLYSAADLREDFAELAIDRLDECTATLDESANHRGPAALVRIVARRC